MSELGPCVICGDTGYNLSCGGPTICPKCDCGHFDAATVEKQAKVIAALRQELERSRGLLTLALHTEGRSIPAQTALESKAKAALAYLIDNIVYSDCYGVEGSGFQACHLCQGGGAPGVPMIHEDRCPVLKCEAIAEEWWQERHEGEIEELCDIIKAKDAQVFVAEQEIERLKAALSSTERGAK